MGSKAKNESSYTLKLPLLSASHGQMQMQSPERSEMLTPPFRASASVPFRWEEEPGKPKSSTALTTFSNPIDFAHQKSLELPPRLLLETKSAKHPSTVVEGPYMSKSSRFQSYSFRTGSECYGSFRHGSCTSPDQTMQLVLSKKGYKEKVLGSMRRALKGRREVGGNSYVFPSNSGDRDSECSGEGEESSSSTSAKITRIRRVGSFPGLSTSNKSHFWASIYQGIKQVVPWSKKVKKDDLVGKYL
ncbi:hypothetical protein PTKIN_Ptkin15bG0055800 [Pterospermum kingtungense]